MITPALKFIYDRKKVATSSVEAPVELRITFNRKAKYITTGIRLLPKHWRNQSVTNRADAMELNTLLDELMVKVRKVINAMLEEGCIVIDEIPVRLKLLAQGRRSFLEFCQQRAEIRIYGKKDDTAERYFRFLRWLRNWGHIIYFPDVTDKNIMKMDEELAATGMKNYSKWNNYHRFMNGFILDAIDEGFLKRNPYKWLHIEKEKSHGLHKFLTLQEFRDLEQAEMITPCLERVRDMFVFQTYTCLSYSDLAEFDVEECHAMPNNKILYTGKRKKTGKEFCFVLMEGAQRILDKYNNKLPIITNIKYNEYLKVVAQNAGIDKPITSHWARHTGATMLLNEGNVDMEIVAKVLGHSSTRQTRETYAKLLDVTVVNAMSKAEKRLSGCKQQKLKKHSA